MVNRHRHVWRILLYHGVELLGLSGAFFAAYFGRQWTSVLWGVELRPLETYLWLWPITAAIWSGLLWGFNTYHAFRVRSLIYHGFALGGVSALGVVALFALLTVLKQHDINRSFVGLIGVASFLLLFMMRMVAGGFLTHYTQKGYDRHYVVVGGTGPEARSLAASLEAIPGSVYQVRGFVSEDPAEKGAALDRWKVLGTFEEVPAIASHEPVDEVYLLPQEGALDRQRALVEQCEIMGITVHLRLAPFERMLSRLEIHESAGTPFLSFSTAPRNGAGLVVKRLMDFSGALAMLALLSPFLALVGLLIRLTSRGPAVFRQDRSGMNGRVFTLYKFRTMTLGAEKQRSGLEAQNEMQGPVFKIKDDPRVTGLGKWLRKSSIDELPQLWNILKGDMSLVGPRPLPVYEVEKFERWQRRRMAMRPGITCLWQIMGRNRVTDFSEWMKLDLEYVDRWSLGLDLKILLRTIPAVLGGRGAY